MFQSLRALLCCRGGHAGEMILAGDLYPLLIAGFESKIMMSTFSCLYDRIFAKEREDMPPSPLPFCNI